MPKALLLLQRPLMTLRSLLRHCESPMATRMWPFAWGLAMARPDGMRHLVSISLLLASEDGFNSSHRQEEPRARVRAAAFSSRFEVIFLLSEWVGTKCLGPGALPRRSGRRRPQGHGDLTEESCVRAGGGECDADTAGGFADAGTDLEEPYAQGGELGLGQSMGPRDGVADGEHQPVGGGVQDQAHLVGQRRAARGPVAFELSLLHLDQVLGLAAGTVDHVIDVLGRSLRQVGDDETGVPRGSYGECRL